MRQCHNYDNYDIIKLFLAMKIVCESFSARRRIVLASIAASCTDAFQWKPDKTLLAVYPVDFWNSRRSQYHWKYVAWHWWRREEADAEVRGMFLSLMSPGSSFLNCSATGLYKNKCTAYAVNWGAHRSIFNWSKPSPPLIFAKVWGTTCWWSGGCPLVWDSSASLTEWPNGLLSRQRTFAIPDIDGSYF